jgi:hypothetical protein
MSRFRFPALPYLLRSSGYGKDNIKMGLSEIGWGVVDWIGLTQDMHRWNVLLNSVMNLRVP